MERKRSNKPVINIKDCLYKFIFDIDGKGKTIIPASPAHFYSLKVMSRVQKFHNYKEQDYDPFET